MANGEARIDRCQREFSGDRVLIIETNQDINEK